MYATWHVHERERLDREIRTLSDRLRATRRRPGLRSRSIHSFLTALLAHKRERLDSLVALTPTEGPAP